MPARSRAVQITPHDDVLIGMVALAKSLAPHFGSKRRMKASRRFLPPVALRLVNTQRSYLRGVEGGGS